VKTPSLYSVIKDDLIAIARGVFGGSGYVERGWEEIREQIQRLAAGARAEHAAEASGYRVIHDAGGAELWECVDCANGHPDPEGAKKCRHCGRRFKRRKRED
jgi:hypothetical protein